MATFYSSGTRTAADNQRINSIATANFPAFISLMTKAHLSKTEKKKQLHELLGIKRDELDIKEGDHNVIISAKSMRGIWGTLPTTNEDVPVALYSWLDTSPHPAVALLLCGKVACTHCYKINAKSGTLAMVKGTLDVHATSDMHVRAVAKHKHRAKDAMARQLTLEGGGMKRKTPATVANLSSTLAVAKLVAGGGGSAGIPPTAISCLLDQSFTTLTAKMNHGFPQGKAIVKTYMPSGVELAESRIRDMVAGKKISFAIDGGAAEIDHGVKVIVLNALSPQLKYAVTLSLTFRLCHEDAKSQADAINEATQKYCIRKEDVQFVVADNAAVNPATVDLLNAKYGFSVTFARCLPHCFNLYVVTFLKPFNVKFGISTHLKMIRRFIKQGGGMARRSAMLEWGLSLSKIDFSDTRWEAFVRSIVYMMEVQTPKELANARERLQRLYEETNDPTAKEALAEPDVAQRHWRAVWECIENEAEEAMAVDASGDVAPATPEAILAYNADINNFGAFLLLSKVLAAVPSLFQVIQGGPQWPAELHDKKTGDFIKLASMAVAELTQTLDILCDLSARTLLIQEVVTECKSEQEELVKRAVEYGEASEDEVELGKAQRDANLVVLATVLESTLKLAADAAKESPGRAKLDDALAELGVKSRYSLRQCPPPLPESTKDMIAFLGIPDKPGLRSFARVALMRGAWNQHRAKWRSDFQSCTPAEAYDYWSNFSSVNKDLSSIALEHLSHPDNACSAERVMSMLTKLDVPTRRHMGIDTLNKTLFLRANNHVIQDLCDDVHYNSIVIRNGDAAQQKAEEERLAAVVEESVQRLSDAMKRREAEVEARRKKAVALTAAAAKDDVGEALFGESSDDDGEVTTSK